MSDGLPDPKLKFQSDVSALTAALQAGELSVGKFKEAIKGLATGAADGERAHERYTNTVAKMARELRGNGATEQLHLLADAVKEAGARGPLTATQLENLTKKVEALKAAGGSVPASLQAITKGVSSLETALRGQGLAQIETLSSKLGPMGSVLAAVGPAGLIAAAGLGAVTIAGGAMVGAAATMIQKTVEAGDKYDDLSAKTKIGVVALQDFARAGATAGVDVETIAKGVQFLSVEIVKGNPALKALGLDAAKLRTMLPEDAFRAFGARIMELKNPMEQQAALQAVLHKSGKELAGVFENLAAATEKGKTLDMTGAQVKAAADMADAQVRLQGALSAVALQFGSAALQGGGLSKTVDTVTDAAERLATFVNAHKNDIGAFFEAGSQWAQRFIAIAERAAKAGADVASKFPHNPVGGASVGAAAASSLLPGAMLPGIPGAIAGGLMGMFMGDVDKARGQQSTLTGSAEAGGFKQPPGYIDPALAAKAQEIQNRFTRESIQLQKEYDEAVAASTLGLAGLIEKITADADAKRKQIAADKDYSAAQKQTLTQEVDATERRAKANAQAAAALAAHIQAKKLDREAEALLNDTIEAGLSPLEAKVHHMEADAAAQIEDARAALEDSHAQGEERAELEKATNAKIAAIKAHRDGAIARENETDGLKVEAESLASVDRAQRAYADAIERTNPSLQHQIDKIIETRDAAEAQATEAFIAGKITAAALTKDLELYDKVAAAATDLAKRMAIPNAINKGNELLGAGIDAAQHLGMDPNSKAGKILGGVQEMGQGAAMFAEGYAKKDPVEAIIGGIKTAVGLFDSAKAIFGGKSGWQKTLDDLTTEFGKAGAAAGGKWSEQLAKAIDADSKRTSGDKFAATLLHLGDVIKEGGGIQEFGVEKATIATRDLFTALARGAITTQDVAKSFNDVFGDVAQGNISTTTGIASAQLRELVDEAQRFKIESPALRDYLKGQTEGEIGGLTAGLSSMKGLRDKVGGDAGGAAARETRNRLKDSGLSDAEIADRVKRAADVASGAAAAGVGIVSQKAALAIGASVADTFQQLLDQGLSRSDAMAKVTPLIESLRTELKASGFEGGAAFAQLDQWAALAAGEITGPLLSSVSGFTSALVSMSNSNRLTAGTFTGMTEQISANIAALSEQGVVGPQAVQALQPDLQKIWELEQQYHYEVDAGTQALIDQGVKSGDVGEAHRSAADKMIAASEATAVAMITLAEKFGYVATEADKAMKDRHATATMEYRTTGTPPPPGAGGGLSGGGGPPDDESQGSYHNDVNSEGRHYYKAGSFGLVDFGAGTPAMLHGREAVLTRDQFYNPRAGINFAGVGSESARASVSAASIAGYGGGVSRGDVHLNVPEITVHVYDANDPAKVSKAVARALRDGVAGDLRRELGL